MQPVISYEIALKIIDHINHKINAIELLVFLSTFAIFVRWFLQKQLVVISNEQEGWQTKSIFMT